MKRLLSGCVLAAVLSGAVLAQGPVRNVEEDARTRLQSGLRLVGTNPKEALRDFTDVVTGYPTSAVADEALVEIAKYHLDESYDVAEATRAVEALDKYRASDSAPMAYVLKGRVKLMTNRSPETVNSALTDFDRAKSYGESDFVPVAMYYAARTLSEARRQDAAVQGYQQVLSQYPGSVWAARSALGAARAFVQLDLPARAMAVLQLARQATPTLPEAADALAWNTALFRLHVRGAAQQAPFAASDRTLVGSGGKLKDVVALGVDPQGTVFAVQKEATLTFDPSGKPARAIASVSPRGVFFGADGHAILVQRSGLLMDGGTSVPLSIPRADGAPKPLEEPPAAVMTSTRDVLVSDRNTRSIVRFTLAGKHAGSFAAADAQRLAINWLDDVAALDRDAKSVTVFNRDGKSIGTIAARGTGYELRNPVDIAYDALGHLLLLDRAGDNSSVLVFKPSGQLLTRFRSVPKTPGAFQDPAAFALDRVGRLYVYDDKTERVLIYK